MTTYNVEIGVAVSGNGGDSGVWYVTSFEVEAPQEAGEDTLLELARAEFVKENEEPMIHTWLYFWEEADPQYAEAQAPLQPAI